MAVTKPEVQAVFDAANAASTPDSARSALVDGLTPLFNAGGSVPGGTSGTFGPFRHIQSASASAWVVAHNLGRMPVGIHVVDSANESIGCKVQHNEALTSFTCFHGAPISGSVSYA